jgi:hypothetical protein
LELREKNMKAIIAAMLLAIGVALALPQAVSAAPANGAAIARAVEATSVVENVACWRQCNWKRCWTKCSGPRVVVPGIPFVTAPVVVAPVCRSVRVCNWKRCYWTRRCW